jgi:hypothetical protein
MVTKKNNNFKYDLQLGKVAEDKVGDIFSNKTIEVKRDFMAQETGNVFIEYMCRNKLSGISTSKADYYAFVVSFTQVVFIETAKLKDLCRKYIGTPYDVKGGDENKSKGILLSLIELVNG